jgi:hypothetical protein
MFLAYAMHVRQTFNFPSALVGVTECIALEAHQQQHL